MKSVTWGQKKHIVYCLEKYTNGFELIQENFLTHKLKLIPISFCVDLE